MAADKEGEKKTGAGAAADRRERLAAELRANLRKRKTRTRAAVGEGGSDTKKPG